MMQKKPRIAFLRITEDTIISHRIYDSDFFSQLSHSFETIRIDHYRRVENLPGWLEDLHRQGVDYVFVFIFWDQYLHYVEMLRVRNERCVPVGFILVPCILEPHLEATYRALPAHIGDRDVVFVFSEFVRRRLGEISKRYDDFATPCFIDFDTFPENTKAPSETLDIFFCARLTPDKGLVELLRALDRIKREGRLFRLHVVTDARPGHAPKPYLEEVNRLFGQLDLKPDVTFYGSLLDEQQRRKNLMAGCDVLVHLTTSEGETFGRIVVEGFAAGLAVITTNWQGVNESVTSENGYLIEVHRGAAGRKRIDIEDVVSALRALYRPETLAGFKRVNRAKARQYDFRAHVERLRAVIDARLGSARSS